MNFFQIIRKWIRKRVDYDKAYGYQCVDWVRQYCLDAGIPIGTFGGSAINGWNTGRPFDSKWKRVVNTQYNFPKRGDIIFWKRGKYGHVAIAGIGSNNDTLVVIEQNAGQGDGDGKGGDEITRRTMTYTGVVGWFTFIG